MIACLLIPILLVDVATAASPAPPLQDLSFERVRLRSGLLCVQREEFSQEAYATSTGRNARDVIEPVVRQDIALLANWWKRDIDMFLGNRLPMVGITLDEVMEIANTVSQSRGMPAAYEAEQTVSEGFVVTRRRSGVRLPTLREWYELAERVRLPRAAARSCRAANVYDDAAYALFGATSGHAGIRCNDGFALLSPPGSFPPDRSGLFDVWGGVAELIEPAEISVGAGPEPRLVNYVFQCGGSYAYPHAALGPEHCFVASPQYRSVDVGFRLVYSPEDAHCE